ncbi:MAG: hypothetical protein COW24_01330 [Candidatus Kerfeldbacteria bacterium CG15_BIG_FIL_POST_REV_8_21_14_020_45_12]|uniref:O-antigen ligase-related domain-containing protein n=1 Tax=Candidatus Kerfeldbacteria bacterium CG15_BIG_FIL_POST_REV_8_21_14_020_45_12 TaxID=2014247 RepID=A0A2M7H4Q9_9BACT|nr:MAG: hypothetical protein COW24_01330 [Candidatus Kerfeldbacteria bacterium CG15_BIG_FIL_POST_REV_8_21_14_020_45_12]PJA93942.1 MAG: hypothetical protein CO132_00665 [Candidatus Kerfeldbacteria bacterium CG_4_9_14_3_um_filter_45_8]
MTSLVDSIKKLRQWLHPRQLLIAPILIVLIMGLGFAIYRVSPFFIFAGLGVIGLAMVVFRNPWHGLYLIAFFLPFERIGSYDMGGVTIRPSQVTALLTMLSATMYFLGRKRFNLPSLPILAPLGVFVIAQLIGLLVAPNLERAILVTVFTWFTFGISLLVPTLIRTKADVRSVLKWMFAALLIVGLFGIYQFLGDLAGLPPELTGLRELYTKDILGFPRVQSTALEPLYYANYLLIPLSILLAFFFSREKSFHPLWVVSLFGLGVVNMALTVARGGYIAFAVSCAIIVVYFFFQLKLITWRNLWYIFLVGVLALGIASQAVGVDVIQEQFLSHVTDLFGGASYNERAEMFDVAYVAWLDHPIFGIGSGSFGPYESAHPYTVPEHGWRIVNNEYLEVLAENGAVGLTALIVIFLIVIVRSVKAVTRAEDPFIKAALVGLCAAFIGILVQYNTFSVLYIVHIWFAVGLLVALQNIALAPKPVVQK